eukprot:6218-Eustigmatos_ZCMA.PRE.1
MAGADGVPPVMRLKSNALLGSLMLPAASCARAVSIRLGAAQQRAAVVDVHHGVGLGRAGDGRSGVISRVATAQRPLH